MSGNGFVPTRAEILIEGEIRRAERDTEQARECLLAVIEEEKVAHSRVEFWRDEINQAVAKRQELEASLRRLRNV